MPSASNRWVSYYISVPSQIRFEAARVIDEHLCAGKQQGLIYRYFYIAYMEGGFHFRLRFTRRRYVKACSISASMNNLITGLRQVEPSYASRVSCRRVAYNRERDYFGFTMRSVYAELLNVQTTSLARLMQNGDLTGRHQRAVLYVSALWLIGATPEQQAARIAGSRTFIGRALSAAPVHKPVLTRSGSKQAGLGTHLYEFGNEGSILRLISRLAQRVSRLDGGLFVYIHAIHLLLNKLHYSLEQEAFIYEASAALAARSRLKADEFHVLSLLFTRGAVHVS